MQSTNLLVIIVITSLAISGSILASYIATIMSFFPSRSWLYPEKSILSTSPSSLLLGPTGGSEIKGVRGDVRPIQIYRSNITPEVKDYYDILSVSVMKVNNKLTFYIVSTTTNQLLVYLFIHLSSVPIVLSLVSDAKENYTPPLGVYIFHLNIVAAP